jgi:hypothetical protein
MRVAVRHTDPTHPNAGVAAYGRGDVEDFTHPFDPSLNVSADDVMVALLDKARAEFPEADGYQVRPEALVPDGDEACYLCAGAGNIKAPCSACATAGEVQELCPTCSGTGIDPEDLTGSTCLDCDGRKYLSAAHPKSTLVGENADELPAATVCPVCDGKQYDATVAPTTCSNCKGAKRTPKSVWKAVDEQALRARASGEPVEVPLVEHLNVPQVSVSTDQPSAVDTAVPPNSEGV